MDIEQIGLFILGWFAVGFLVALALGKFIREANRFDDEQPHAAGASGTAVRYLRQSKPKTKRQRGTKVATARSEKRANRAAN